VIHPQTLKRILANLLSLYFILENISNTHETIMEIHTMINVTLERVLMFSEDKRPDSLTALVKKTITTGIPAKSISEMTQSVLALFRLRARSSAVKPSAAPDAVLLIC
jgi:hypothetical protein